MNETIKDLAVQAKIQMVSEPRLQEFAELIIRQCMNICEDVTERNDPAIACYYEIKRHFGVEK
jgi:hypothetical protein